METATSTPRLVRHVHFQPYHRATSPVPPCTYALKVFTPHRTPTEVRPTISAPAHHGQAKISPRRQMRKAGNSKLYKLDPIQVVQWVPDAELPRERKSIPLKVACKYKQYSKCSISTRKGRMGGKRRQNDAPHTLRPRKTTTYMARQYNSPNLILHRSNILYCTYIEHIGIKGAYLHENVVQNGPEPVYIMKHARINGPYKHKCKGGRQSMTIYGTPTAGHTYLSAIFKLLWKPKFAQSEADRCL